MKELMMSLSFNPFDIFILATLVLTTFLGGLRGLISQASAIISWLLSAYVASHYYQPVAALFKASPSLQIPAAIIITFIATFILLKIATRFVKNVATMAGLKEFDRQMGALLGLCKGFIFCLLGTFFLVVASESTLKVIEESKSGTFFASILAEINRHMPQSDLILRYQTNVESLLASKQTTDAEERLGDEIFDLKEYLSKYVFSEEASDIVANKAACLKQSEVDSSASISSQNEQKGTNSSSFFSWRRSEGGEQSASASSESWSNEDNYSTTSARTTEVESGVDNRASEGTTSVFFNWFSRPGDNSIQAQASSDANSDSLNTRLTNGLDSLASFLTSLGNGSGSVSNSVASSAQVEDYGGAETYGIDEEKTLYEGSAPANENGASDSYLRLKSRNFKINDRTMF